MSYVSSAADFVGCFSLGMVCPLNSSFWPACQEKWRPVSLNWPVRSLISTRIISVVYKSRFEEAAELARPSFGKLLCHRAVALLQCMHWHWLELPKASYLHLNIHVPIPKNEERIDIMELCLPWRIAADKALLTSLSSPSIFFLMKIWCLCV